MAFWWPKRKPKPQPTRAEVREFIRHTVDFPIEFRLLRPDERPDTTGLPDLASSDGDGAAREAGNSRNVGFGGLAFESNFCPNVGNLIEIRIPTVNPPFIAKARVAWCRAEPDGGYMIGAMFLDASDAFRSRMVQQVCSIENYRKEVKEKEGRELSVQEASAEWIGKYAGRFPTAGGKA
ncbi:MAG TPA: PilZ domain-containing protein [Longimicrobiales bacterium]